MHRRGACAGLVWFALVCATATAQAAAPLPAAELFFGAPDYDSARLSPSGRWLAVTAGAANGRFALAVLDTTGAVPPTVVAHYSDTDIGRFSWVNDERLVFDLVDLELGSGDRAHAPGLFSARRDGSEVRMLVRTRRDRGQGTPGMADRALSPAHALLHVPAGGGDEVVVGEALHTDLGEPTGVLPKRLNVVTGRARSLAFGGPPHVRRWLFDQDGAPRAAVAPHEGRLRVYWRQDPALQTPEAWAEIGQFDGMKVPWAPRFVDAAGQLYVTASSGPEGYSVLKRFDFSQRQPEREPLANAPGFDFNGTLITEVDGGRVLGVRGESDAEISVWFDADMQALQAEIDRRLPGRVNRLDCRRCSQPDRTVLVTSWSDREPGQFWLWRGTPDQPLLWQRVGSRRKGIDPRQMATLDFQRFAARDGRRIPVWVTTPAAPVSALAAGASGAATAAAAAGAAVPSGAAHVAPPPALRPAVVLVHGGPWVRGGHWGWDAMPQFLASRGYVVIEPEFRGSTGYGAAHFRAGWKQWGRAMQDDVADAVRWAAAQKLIDPARVCIAGASYGGYAALMGLVNDPGLYRCGAAWVAVTEPALLFKSSWQSDMSDEARHYQLPLLLGDPEADAQMLRDVSPVVQAARIQAPLLLAYGEMDRRVPLQHGQRLRAALQAAGREPDYVVYAGEGHSWQRSATRVDFARRLESFLAQHLP